jgi:hypothetical protein
MARNLHAAGGEAIRLQKEKGPAVAGPFDEFHFRSAHFASLAI